MWSSLPAMAGSVTIWESFPGDVVTRNRLLAYTMTSMDAIPPDTPQQSRGEARRAAADELVRSLVAAGVSLLAGLALLWAVSHTGDIARAGRRLRDWADPADRDGPPPEYWWMLPGLHRDIRRFESGHGRMAGDDRGGARP